MNSLIVEYKFGVKNSDESALCFYYMKNGKFISKGNLRSLGSHIIEKFQDAYGFMTDDDQWERAVSASSLGRTARKLYSGPEADQKVSELLALWTG